MKILLSFGLISLVINLAKVSVNAVYDSCDKQSTSNTFGLRNKLLCDYDSLSRPSDDTPTIIKFRLIPKFIDFDDASRNLIVHSWMYLSWEDAHFDWRNDAQYSGIPSIHVSSVEIWTPDISVYNSGDEDYYQSQIPTTNCVVKKDKNITCLPAVKYVTRCSSNYQHWPFDRQNCTLRLGSWIHTKQEIDYELVGNGGLCRNRANICIKCRPMQTGVFVETLHGEVKTSAYRQLRNQKIKFYFGYCVMFELPVCRRPMERFHEYSLYYKMIDHTENLEWKVLSVSITKKMVTYGGPTDRHPSVLVNIILERHSTHSRVTVIAPAILLIIMTLTVLWLSPMTFERMILAGLNLICHLICVMDINWQVPSNGATLPSILIFHQSSMAIASVAFFLTVFLRQLEEISIPAPVWLTSTTSMILESRAGQFFLLTTLDPKASATLETVEEDNAGLVRLNSSDPKINPGTSAWHHFATLIDRLSFASIILTYVIMLAVLIPKNDIIDN